MSVRIRLRRMGAKKQAFYRIVVADSRSPRDGRFLDNLGTYNPRTVPVAIELDREKTLRWLEDGALPTDSARSLLSQVGIWQEFQGHGAIKLGPATQSETPEPAGAEPTAVLPEAAEETLEAGAPETRGEE